MQRTPVLRQQGEVQIVEHVVGMVRLVIRVVIRSLTQAKALQTHDKFFRRATATLGAKNFHAFSDVSLAQGTNLWSKQVFRLLEALDYGLVDLLVL